MSLDPGSSNIQGKRSLHRLEEELPGALVLLDISLQIPNYHTLPRMVSSEINLDGTEINLFHQIFLFLNDERSFYPCHELRKDFAFELETKLTQGLSKLLTLEIKDSQSTIIFLVFSYP